MTKISELTYKSLLRLYVFASLRGKILMHPIDTAPAILKLTLKIAAACYGQTLGLEPNLRLACGHREENIAAAAFAFE